MNDYLKRGEGKNKANIKKDNFYKFYLQNAKERIVERKQYNAFVKDLLAQYSTEIVTKGLEVKVTKVGKFRIRSKALHFFKANGEKAKSLRPNWKATWEYWENKHPGLSRDEITKIENKTVLYHENDHSNQEFYEHYWDKITINLINKSFYNFKASRQFSRLLAKVVKDPNRKTFYYG
jgi:hypothetical protein